MHRCKRPGTLFRQWMSYPVCRWSPLGSCYKTYGTYPEAWIESTSFKPLGGTTKCHSNGKTREEYAEFCRGADLLIHDAEYTPGEYEYTRTWGHTVYTDALELALSAGVGKFGLFHHNQNRSDQDMDEMVLNCRDVIRQQDSPLECFALTQSSEFTL